MHKSDVLDPATPCLIQVDGALRDMYTAGTPLRTDLDGFYAKFQEGKEGHAKTLATQGVNTAKACSTFRAQRLLLADMGQAFAADVMKAMHLELIALSFGANLQALQSLLQASTFGLAANYEGASSEKEQLACFRLSIAGTRTVIMVTTAGLIERMKTKSLIQEAFGLKTLWQYLKTMPKEAILECVKSNSVWHGTVGPNNTLYTPAGMCLLERVPNADVVGVRVGVASASFVELAASLAGILGKAGVRMPVLEQALERCQASR